ncbi:hypothetical protein [Carnobacterium sp.]
MGQLFKSDTSIDELFSKFVLDPEEAIKTKEVLKEENEKNETKTDNKIK